MDIHKPKPWHGLREFAKEFATIVLGVLVALGAEQTVEWAHVQTQVREAREALHEEIVIDATTAADAMEEDRCLDAWFNRLDVWAKGGARPDIPRSGAGFENYPTTVWDIARTGAVPHMPLKDQLAYAQFYNRIQNENAVVESQRKDGQKIASYQAQERLTPDQARSLLEATGFARPLLRAKQQNGPRILEAAGRLGAAPRAMSVGKRERLTAFCAMGGAAPPAAQR